jgi:hypothetical protein
MILQKIDKNIKKNSEGIGTYEQAALLLKQLQEILDCAHSQSVF